MPRITNLKPCRRERGRLAVYLDGEYAFSVPLSDSAVLERGRILEEKQIRDYRQADVRFQAHRRALRYLGTRARSTREVEQELARRGFPTETIAPTVARLQAEGLLDDADYAMRYVRDRLRLKPRSSTLLRQELRRKGISGEPAELALAPIDDESVARRIVESRWPRWQKLPPDRRRDKVLGYLRNRGFSRGACIRAYRHGCSLPETTA